MSSEILKVQCSVRTRTQRAASSWSFGVPCRRSRAAVADWWSQSLLNPKGSQTVAGGRSLRRPPEIVATSASIPEGCQRFVVLASLRDACHALVANRGSPRSAATPGYVLRPLRGQSRRTSNDCTRSIVPPTPTYQAAESAGGLGRNRAIFGTGADSWCLLKLGLLDFLRESKNQPSCRLAVLGSLRLWGTDCRRIRHLSRPPVGKQR